MLTLVWLLRKLEGSFPYYEEEDLDILRKLGVNIMTDVSVNDVEFRNYVSSLELDWILVSSFHQIIKKELINLRYQFPPSLLPKYRGPNRIGSY